MNAAATGKPVTLFHIDMDAFYVNVTLRRHREYHDPRLPVYVGGAHRGVVLSANYAARSFGIHGGMSSTQARRLCPHAIALAPNYDDYEAASSGVFAIFDSFSPRVQVVSIDEAYIDVTGALWQWDSPVQLATHIRAAVADEQRLPCSVGIGPNKLVAKMASKAAKPDGIKEVTPDDVTQFFHPLPVEELWGVGESTAGTLRRYGLQTVGDVAYTPLPTLQRAFGHHRGAQLADMAWGRGSTALEVQVRERSIGSQETLSRDCDDPAVIRRELLRLADRTAARMRRAKMCARALTVSLRFSDFTELTRTRTLTTPTNVTDEIYHAALKIWNSLHLQRVRIRRVGVRAERLVSVADAAWQPRLDEPERGWREAEEAIDAAVARFGPAAVQRARLTG